MTPRERSLIRLRDKPNVHSRACLHHPLRTIIHRVRDAQPSAPFLRPDAVSAAPVDNAGDVDRLEKTLRGKTEHRAAKDTPLTSSLCNSILVSLFFFFLLITVDDTWDNYRARRNIRGCACATVLINAQSQATTRN